MSRSVVYLFFLTLFVHSSFQIGTLWVNQIWGNSDAHKLSVEDVVFDDSTMIVDFINGLTSVGVYVEQVQFVHGNVNVPGFAHVHGTATFIGALFANGGIYADNGNASTPTQYSFEVEDITGNTYIAGQLRPFGGIDAGNGLFTVHNITGDTRICCALLKPNGGIEVGTGQFDVSADDGSFRTEGDATISLDLLLGPSSGLPTNVLITRFPAANNYGGNFIIKGQDSASVGGNLIFLPGSGDTPGNIYFGRASNDNLFIGRSGVTATGVNGGVTTFGGQNAFNGYGGDLTFVPGYSFLSGKTGYGGDIIFDVGLSTENGLPGKIILGSEIAGKTNYGLIITRPSVQSTLGGCVTSFIGQNSTGSSGGDLYLRAGDVNDGSGTPGDLGILPGVSLTSQGNINVGQGFSDLLITRDTVYEAAGDTYFIGQDSETTNGGDLHLRAGFATNIQDSIFDGGNLWIMPGTSNGATAGAIVWGNAAQNLVVKRADNLGFSTPTTLNGQTSQFASGGDFNVISGNGNTQGGSLYLNSGNGAFTGGAININAGGGNPNGGDISFLGGFGDFGLGGSVTISTANTYGPSGDITFTSGSGATPGNIEITNSASSFLVNGAPVVVSAGQVTLQSGANTLVISSPVAANNNHILTFNGRNLLIPTVTGIQNLNPNVADNTNVYQIVDQLSYTLQQIVCALGPNGHGLVTLVSTSDQVSSVC